MAYVVAVRRNGRASIAYCGSVAGFRKWLRAVRGAGSIAALARHLASVN